MQYAPPPYSCTDVRTLKPAGTTSDRVAVRRRRRTSTTRPPSVARPSSHQTTPFSIHGNVSRTPARATISAEIGDDHVPYAATVFWLDLGFQRRRLWYCAMRPTREQAWETLTRYTTSEALLRHALAVEASVGFYARLYGEDEEFWRATALLHDFDYEIHPTLDKHPQDGAPILREEGYPEELIEAVLSHAEHLAMPRDTQLKKVLFACDELSGFVHACGLVRPTGLDGLEPKSVKKKLKQPSFAAGVHRDEVYAGAELLGARARRAHRERRRRDAADRARARAQDRRRRSLGVALEEREDAVPRVLGASANSSCLRSKKLCGAPAIDHDLVLDPGGVERLVERLRVLDRDRRDRRRPGARGSARRSPRPAGSARATRRDPRPGRP